MTWPAIVEFEVDEGGIAIQSVDLYDYDLANLITGSEVERGIVEYLDEIAEEKLAEQEEYDAA